MLHRIRNIAGSYITAKDIVDYVSLYPALYPALSTEYNLHARLLYSHAHVLIEA